MKIQFSQISGKWKLKVISSQCSRMILRSSWAIQSLKVKVKMGPDTPTDPKSELVDGAQGDLSGFETVSVLTVRQISPSL